MKKVLKIGHLVSLGQSAMLLAFRSGKTITINNLEAKPSDKIKFEKSDTELIIRIQLNDNDFLAIEDEKGIAEQVIL